MFIYYILINEKLLLLILSELSDAVEIEIVKMTVYNK